MTYKLRASFHYYFLFLHAPKRYMINIILKSKARDEQEKNTLILIHKIYRFPLIELLVVFFFFTVQTLS